MVVGSASLYLSRRLLGLPNFRGTLSTSKRGLRLCRCRLAGVQKRVLPCLRLRMPMVKLLPYLLCSLRRACSAAHHASLVKLTVLALLPAVHLHKSFRVHRLSPTVSLRFPVELVLILYACRKLVEHRHQIDLLVRRLAVVCGRDQ